MNRASKVMFSPFLAGRRHSSGVGLLLVLCLAGSQLGASESCLQSTGMTQVVSTFMATDEHDQGGRRTWVDFNEVRDKTIAEARAMNIGCFYILKPEKRRESMALLFQIYEKYEKKPYINLIIANWLKLTHVGSIDKGNSMMWPYCEDQWQYGDLNADGIVDMEDLALYGSVK